MEYPDVMAWLKEQAASDPERGVTAMSVQVFSQFEAEMRRQGLNQTELAQLAGLHRAHLSRLINDPRNVTIGTLVRIANALGLKLELNAKRAAEWNALRLEGAGHGTWGRLQDEDDNERLATAA